MSFLIDSHVVIWWFTDNPRLTSKARKVISEGSIYVSVASAYEIGLKSFSGRWKEAEPTMHSFSTVCEKAGFGIIPITLGHALAAAAFQIDHRDPFDRLLAAQSLVEDMPLVTIDPAFRLFGCKTIW